jgi:hypothetical protein
VIAHQWTFTRQFRRHAFGWREQLPVQRVKEAVAEIKRAARTDPVLGAEGAVLFLERVSPALEQVDSSSGRIGTAVGRAIDDLEPLIAKAEVGADQRQAWLERLFDALQADEIPYIEELADRWGNLCASGEVASRWADELLPITRHVLEGPRHSRGYFKGPTACLSSLYAAGRHDELIALLANEDFWHYRKFAVQALAAVGRPEEAIQLAESLRSPWTPDSAVDRMCEQILLAVGDTDRAYAYGLSAHHRSTFAATFRAVAAAYPSKPKSQILQDLAATTPGDEGKWFAAAKDAGLYEEAIALARRSPCDPRTLARAARDFSTKEPSFAIESGLLALYWIGLGYGFELTGADVEMAYAGALDAAVAAGSSAQTQARIDELVAEAPSQWLKDVVPIIVKRRSPRPWTQS